MHSPPPWTQVGPIIVPQTLGPHVNKWPTGPSTTFFWEFSHWSWEREVNFLPDNKVIRMNAQDTSAKIPTIYKYSIQSRRKIDVEVREKEKWAREGCSMVWLYQLIHPLFCFNELDAELWKNTHEEMKTRHHLLAFIEINIYIFKLISTPNLADRNQKTKNILAKSKGHWFLPLYPSQLQELEKTPLLSLNQPLPKKPGN